MQEKNIKSILDRRSQGKDTEEDRAFLESWYVWNSRKSDNRVSYDPADLLKDTDQVWKRLQPNRYGSIKLLPYAAAILIIGFFSFWMWIQWSTRELDPAEVVAKSDSGATLTLADGRVISLSQAHQGISMGDGIRYEDGTSVEGVGIGKIQSLMINVPAGVKYHIALDDGTMVWLNAGSSLKYPSQFTDRERRVELSGEAYFEVAKKDVIGRDGKMRRQDFVVKTEQQTISVLGTHFNVVAYSSGVQRTTLLEGRVNVSSGISSAELTPGQQATTNHGQIRVQNADSDSSIAWRSGLFSFSGKRFDDVMEEIARWYDLEVVYEGGIPQETFFGEAYRSDNLGEVLRLLESAQVKYRVTADKKLIITNK